MIRYQITEVYHPETLKKITVVIEFEFTPAERDHFDWDIGYIPGEPAEATIISVKDIGGHDIAKEYDEYYIEMLQNRVLDDTLLSFDGKHEITLRELTRIGG